MFMCNFQLVDYQSNPLDYEGGDENEGIEDFDQYEDEDTFQQAEAEERRSSGSDLDLDDLHEDTFDDDGDVEFIKTPKIAENNWNLGITC